MTHSEQNKSPFSPFTEAREGGTGVKIRVPHGSAGTAESSPAIYRRERGAGPNKCLESPIGTAESAVNLQASLRDAETFLMHETGDKSPAYYRVVPPGLKRESLVLTPMGSGGISKAGSCITVCRSFAHELVLDPVKVSIATYEGFPGSVIYGSLEWNTAKESNTSPEDIKVRLVAALLRCGSPIGNYRAHTGHDIDIAKDSLGRPLLRKPHATGLSISFSHLGRKTNVRPNRHESDGNRRGEACLARTGDPAISRDVAPTQLRPDVASNRINLNANSCETWAAVSFGGCRVGIDAAWSVEFRGKYSFHRAFQKEEFDHFVGQMGGNREEGAAFLWSAKEAAAKALGCGFNLVDPLCLSVSLLDRSNKEDAYGVTLVGPASDRFPCMGDEPIPVRTHRDRGVWISFALIDPVRSCLINQALDCTA